jgi:dienelactone hydrolase
MAIQTQNVEYTHGNQTFEGFLAFDDAPSAKRPGVLVVHEWWGLNDYIRRRAKEIAQLGYVAFAIDMYGKGVVTESHEQAGKLMNALMTNPDAKARAEAGLNVLQKDAHVDAGKIAALGYCMGGSMALHMARAGMPIVAVVTFHAGLGASGNNAAGPIKAKIQVHTGADDPMIDADARKTFEDEMRKGGADWQMNVYGGARHAFTNPAADSKGLPPLKYDAKADKRSWQAMTNFLAEVFA